MTCAIWRNEIEALLDTARRTLEAAMTHQLFVGPIADETGLGVSENRRLQQQAAELLRQQAVQRERQAAQIENTDSAWTDVGDFVTGTDFTPWS